MGTCKTRGILHHGISGETAGKPNRRQQCIKTVDLQKGEEDKVIGALTFSNIVKGVFLSCFLGYNLDKDEINMGYMTEAVKKGIEIMFQDYGLHRIEASIMPRNIRSLKVTQKLGFQEEGLSPQYLKINGKWEDHLHMVLLNHDINE